MPSPLASTPYSSHVPGMNCIQPTAPAELGPMLRPKFDSTLLIAASTCQGMPYCAPAPCQSPSSCAWSSTCGCAGGGGTKAVLVVGTTWKTSARAVPARNASRISVSAARRTGSAGRDDAQARQARVHGCGGERGDERRVDRRRLLLGVGGHRIRGALPLRRLIEGDEEVVLVRRGVRRDLAVDAAGEH